MAADITATGSGSSAAATTHAVALGAGTADKAIYIGFLQDPGTVTPPAGWTIVQSGAQGSGSTRLFGYVMTRAATSDTNVDVTTTNSVESVHIWRVFSGSDIASAVVPTPGVGTNAAPNPPASGTLPSGDYLVDTWRLSGRIRDHTAYPTNYDDDQTLNEALGSPRAAASSRTLIGITSEDPGVYGLNLGSEWVAFTIAVPEAGGTVHELTGVIAGVGDIDGDLVIRRVLTGQVDGAGVLGGDMLRRRDLGGAIGGVGTLAGTLTIPEAGVHDMTGVIAGTGSIVGVLVPTRNLAGAIVGVGTLNGDLIATRLLTGQITGVGTLTGVLAIVGPVVGDLVVVIGPLTTGWSSGRLASTWQLGPLDRT